MIQVIWMVGDNEIIQMFEELNQCSDLTILLNWEDWSVRLEGVSRQLIRDNCNHRVFGFVNNLQRYVKEPVFTLVKVITKGDVKCTTYSPCETGFETVKMEVGSGASRIHIHRKTYNEHLHPHFKDILEVDGFSDWGVIDKRVINMAISYRVMKDNEVLRKNKLGGVGRQVGRCFG